MAVNPLRILLIYHPLLPLNPAGKGIIVKLLVQLGILVVDIITLRNEVSSHHDGVTALSSVVIVFIILVILMVLSSSKYCGTYAVASAIGSAVPIRDVSGIQIS